MTYSLPLMLPINPNLNFLILKAQHSRNLTSLLCGVFVPPNEIRDRSRFSGKVKVLRFAFVWAPGDEIALAQFLLIDAREREIVSPRLTSLKEDVEEVRLGKSNIHTVGTVQLYYNLAIRGEDIDPLERTFGTDKYWNILFQPLIHAAELEPHIPCQRTSKMRVRLELNDPVCCSWCTTFWAGNLQCQDPGA